MPFYINYSPLNLDKLTYKCQNLIQEKLKNLEVFSDHSPEDLLRGLQDLICTNAERKSYGIRCKESILYEDESPEAMYFWEI